MVIYITVNTPRYSTVAFHYPSYIPPLKLKNAECILDFGNVYSGVETHTANVNPTVALQYNNTDFYISSPLGRIPIC